MQLRIYLLIFLIITDKHQQNIIYTTIVYLVKNNTNKIDRL